MKKSIIFVFLIIILSSCAYALNEIVVSTNKLNYWNSDTHTIYVENTDTSTTRVEFSIPSGFAFSSSTNCTVPVPGTIRCDIPPGQKYPFQVTSSASASEYGLTTFSPTTNNSYTGNNVSFLRIKEDEIFHTLVEYGRGRGNYFFDSMGQGLAGSGHTGSGCRYLPNGTLFELNFLHKILNIQQYFGLANADAENVSFTCTYPDKTVVRQHLSTSIQKSGGLWTVAYFISQIGGSWERMGYLGMDFDAGEYNTSQNFTINCTNLIYSLPAAYGNITVSQDSFNLEIRDRNPFNVTASTATGAVGNGTQEVIISYTITNSEIYDAQDVVIEIEAPQYATFIGTRGELWGVGRDQYRIEKTELQAGQSETIELVARFDTSNAPSINTLALSQGVKVQYITCWESNAYNPQEYIQYLTVGNNVSVSMGTPVNVVDIVNLLVNINNTVNNVYTTVNVINNTVDNIWNLTWQINQSIANLPYQVWIYPTRNLTYYPPVASYNITVTGGVGGAGGGVACRWNSTEHYNNSLASSNSYQVYGTRWLRVDYNNIYNGSVDVYRTCYRAAPSSTTASGDILQVFLCNDYDGSGNPETEAGCTLIDAHDINRGIFSADKFKWECTDILGKEISGSNISVLFECENCAGTADSWKIALDTLASSTYTFNSSNDGSSWTLESNESVVEWDWCLPIDFGYEVWSYNNRTLTENVTCSGGTCNITALLDQFNCTAGPSTNKMCEIIYAINTTTSNMWTTIQTINSTVNNIWSVTQSIFVDTQTINDLLNCNGTTDTPLCSKTDALNQSIISLNTTINTINNNVNSINNTLYVMNQSIANQFNYTWQLIGNISINVGNLSVSLNCSDPSNNYSTSLCAYVQRIETNTITINNTVNNALSLVQYINGTRWGNMTAWTLYQAILNQSNIISNNFQQILTAISRLQEFQEEMVFLVTDAFNLQQSARKDLDNGDLASAAEKLKEANDKLNAAAMGLVTAQNEVSGESGDGSGFSWVVVALGSIIAIAGLLFYLVSKPKA